MIRAIRAFIEFCYIVRKNIIDTNDLKDLEEALDRFHKYRQVFIDLDLRKDFNLPRQHSAIHFYHLIRSFGAPNGICSSITESKHIKAVKEPWRRSNRYKATIQMMTTNTRLDKLAAMRADFVNRGMLPAISKPSSAPGPSGNVFTDFILIIYLCFPLGSRKSGQDTQSANDVDDDEAVPGPRIMASVQLAKVPTRKITLWNTSYYLILTSSSFRSQRGCGGAR